MPEHYANLERQKTESENLKLMNKYKSGPSLFDEDTRLKIIKEINETK